MSLISNLKKALGFPTDDDPERDGILQDEAPDNAETLTAPASSGQQQTDIQHLADSIFSHVVETFNATLPEFLKTGANAAAQRKWLHDTLDENIKQHLANLDAQATERCRQQYMADKQSLHEQLQKLRQQSKDNEERQHQMTQKQLSADRQKRALQERVHDLESQISKLLADREQLDLENKSLVNKLKVANVFEKENTELHTELNSLQTQLNKMRLDPATESSKALQDAEKALEEARKELAQAKQKLIEKDKLLIDKDKILAQKETALAQNGEAINKNADSLTQKDIALEKTNKELEEAKQRQQALENQIDDLNKKLAEAEMVTQKLAEIDKQITAFQELKQKKDETIAQLRHQLAQQQELIAKHKTEANQGAGLKDGQKPHSGNQPTATKPSNFKPKPGKKPEMGIDDLLNDTDWLLTPKEQRNQKSHKAQRQQRQDNNDDSQLSLF